MGQTFRSARQALGAVQPTYRARLAFATSILPLFHHTDFQLLGKAAATMATGVIMAELGPPSSESSFSGAATDASSNVVSVSSTPPTTVSLDSMSLASDHEMPKQHGILLPLLAVTTPLPVELEQCESGQQTPVDLAIVVADDPPSAETLPAELPSTIRPRRARASLPVYNIARLSNTHRHGMRRAKGDAVGEMRRRTISGDALVNSNEGATGASVGARSDVSDINWGTASRNSPRRARTVKKLKVSPASTQVTTRRATRLSGVPVENLAIKLSALGRRAKKDAMRVSRELKRLRDTNEYAHIDTGPVRYTVWSNGKYVDPAAEEAESRPAASPPRKKEKSNDSAPDAEPGKSKDGDTERQETEGAPAKARRIKKWLDKGLYAGQAAPLDLTKGLTAQEKKKLASIPELAASGKPNRTLPFPMFNGLRMLINGRDSKLPFDVCNPLPPGQRKPAAYRNMTRSRCPFLSFS